jgi:putative DNA primase/helicase
MPTRSMSRSEHELMIGAINSRILAFDNISGLPPKVSDQLCRLATGGGFTMRELYTNVGEIQIYACNPIILNGIETLVSRPDLGSRTITIELPRIDASARSTERRLWEEFKSQHPKLLGGLVNAVSAALRNEGKIKLANTPRMADFANWVCAAEESLPWTPGTFIYYFDKNNAETAQGLLQNHALAILVEELAVAGWEGTSSELLELVRAHPVSPKNRFCDWLDDPSKLGSELRRLSPALRAVKGIVIEDVRTARRRGMRIRREVERDQMAPAA